MNPLSQADAEGQRRERNRAVVLLAAESFCRRDLSRADALLAPDCTLTATSLFRRQGEDLVFSSLGERMSSLANLGFDWTARLGEIEVLSDTRFLVGLVFSEQDAGRRGFAALAGVLIDCHEELIRRIRVYDSVSAARADAGRERL